MINAIQQQRGYSRENIFTGMSTKYNKKFDKNLKDRNLNYASK